MRASEASKKARSYLQWHIAPDSSLAGHAREWILYQSVLIA